MQAALSNSKMKLSCLTLSKFSLEFDLGKKTQYTYHFTQIIKTLIKHYHT